MASQEQRRLLSVWLPDWPVQRLRRARPELAGVPLVLSQAGTRTEFVTACSSEAKRLGIRPGMRTPDAQALAASERLRVLPSAARQDLIELGRLAEACARFSPVVALEDAEAPSALLLDLTGLALLWGDSPSTGERRLGAEVSGWLKEKHLSGVVAIASTVGLALAAARFLRPQSMASSTTPIIIPSDAASSVETLPLEALRIGTDRVATNHVETLIEPLHQLGIETVGDLMRLPRAGLRARFGPELGVRLGQLLGVVPEPLEGHQTDPPLHSEWPFETSVSDVEALDRTLHALLLRLADEMRRRRVGALRVLIRYVLDSPGRTPLVESIGLRLFRPTNCARELAELAKLHSDKLHFRYAVRAIRVLVGSSVPIRAKQRTLFDDRHRDDEHELALLVNRLASRLGSDQVSRLEKRASVDPTRCYALMPAVESPVKRFEQTARQAASARSSPLVRYRQGEPVEVDTDRHGTPTVVVLREPRRVVHHWGPERVETGWWRGRGPRRDAFWVELEDGSRLWLCLDLRSHRWTLAGEFC